MEKSTLFNLIEITEIHNWRKEFEDDNTCNNKIISNYRKELENKLDESTKTMLSYYTLAIKDSMDELHNSIEMRLLNLGIEIGMELQSGFYKNRD